MFKYLFLIFSVCPLLFGCNALKKINGTISENDTYSEFYAFFDDSREKYPDSINHTDFKKVKTFTLSLWPGTSVKEDKISGIRLEDDYLYIVGENNIIDMIPFERLENLECFGIEGGKDFSVSLLSNSRNLKELNVEHNQIDISSLSIFENLEILNILGGTIDNISPVGSLINLKKLSLNCGPITDISPVGNLIRLENLKLYNLDTIDISSMGNLVNLKYLTLFFKNDIDISTFSNLVNLKLLEMHGYGEIHNSNSLFDLVSLEGLTIYSNHFALTHIEKLSNLEFAEFYLDFTITQDDLNNLARLKQMKNLILWRPSFNDISPLVRSPNLTLLDIHSFSYTTIDGYSYKIDPMPLTESNSMERILVTNIDFDDLEYYKKIFAEKGKSFELKQYK
jgi:hypothetical protein